MFRVFNCLTGEHDWRLVVLAGVVCLFASLESCSPVKLENTRNISSRSLAFSR